MVKSFRSILAVKRIRDKVLKTAGCVQIPFVTLPLLGSLVKFFITRKHKTLLKL